MAAGDGFLSGIILAAGASSRMGRPKQLLRLGSRCLLEHVLEAAVASCLDEIILVLGCRAAEIREALRFPRARAVQVVDNPDYAQGQSSSIRLAIRLASPRAAGAGILLGDQPQITSRLIDMVAAAFRAAATPIVRPVYTGRVPGHPVFLARRIWPEIDQLQGDEGARSLITRHPEWLTEVAVAGAPPADIDTREDYERAVDMFQGER